MPEIVRYVVWHPEFYGSWCGIDQDKAWDVAKVALHLRDGLNRGPEQLAAAGWRCSEVRTDA